jgi:hypothetical protein
MPRFLMYQLTLVSRGVLLCAALFACRDAPTSRPAEVEQLPRDGAAYFPTSTSWRGGDANAVGMQASRLNALSEAINGGSYPGLNSLVIVRHGYIVTERYFNGTSAATAQSVFSVTKSVASLLAGIAIDKGLLTTNARVLGVLPEYQSLANADARKAEITLDISSRCARESTSTKPLTKVLRYSDSTRRVTTGRASRFAEPMNANPGRCGSTIPAERSLLAQ